MILVLLFFNPGVHFDTSGRLVNYRSQNYNTKSKLNASTRTHAHTQANTYAQWQCTTYNTRRTTIGTPRTWSYTVFHNNIRCIVFVILPIHRIVTYNHLYRITYVYKCVSLNGKYIVQCTLCIVQCTFYISNNSYTYIISRRFFFLWNTEMYTLYFVIQSVFIKYTRIVFDLITGLSNIYTWFVERYY